MAEIEDVPSWTSKGPASFIVVAAILLELKSRKLLPGPDEVEDDEELFGFEERDRLLARLLELQAYAAASDAFAIMIERPRPSRVPRLAGLEDHFKDLAPDLMADVTVEHLAAAYLVGLATNEVPHRRLLPRHRRGGHVSEAVAELQERLPGTAPSASASSPHTAPPDADHRAVPRPA